MTRLHGILAATVTPLTAEDRIDEAATRRLVDSLIDAGVHGLLPTGSTGEFASLTMDERRQVVEVVLQAAGGRVPIVPHVGAIATRDVVTLARHAKQHGAAGVMVVPPYYEPLSEEEVRTPAGSPDAVCQGSHGAAAGRGNPPTVLGGSGPRTAVMLTTRPIY
jgi:4-hydroxy-tetrahydrodipicolinate synthase